MVVLLFVLGLIYLIFHISLLDGLPDAPNILHSAASIRWDIGFGIGWAVGLAALTIGFSIVWMPLLTNEQITFAQNGIIVVKQRPVKSEQFASDWLNVAEITLNRDRLGVRQSRLMLILLSGKEYVLAEFTGEADLLWLSEASQSYMARFAKL